MYDDDNIEHYKKAVRSMTDKQLVETFRFHGLSLAQMDRAELLAVICFLAKNPMVGMREIHTVDCNES